MGRSRLYYVADPMCSWCWGFAPVLARVVRDLPPDLPLQYVMGGLAPDSDEPMSEAVRQYVQAAWNAVEQATGAHFNRDFWTSCEPLRSTWPACRAVLAAAAQRAEAGPAMFRAIQNAYYLAARNPSDKETLRELALEIPGLDVDRFAEALDSSDTQSRLDADFALRDRLGANGFPTLIFEDEGRLLQVVHGYAPAPEVLGRLHACGALRTSPA